MRILLAIALVALGACRKEQAQAPTPPDVQETNRKQPVAGTQPTKQTDAQIVEKIKTQLKQVDDLRPLADTLRITSDSGVVTLEGEVPTQGAASTLQSMVNDVPGVTHVVNRLTFPKK